MTSGTHASYLTSLSQILSEDSQSRTAGFAHILSSIEEAFYVKSILPDQCVFLAAANHVHEPAAFKVLYSIIRMTRSLDAVQADALRPHSMTLLQYSTTDEPRLRENFWKICTALWERDIALLHPAAACALWRKFLSTTAQEPEDLSDRIELVFRLVRALPTTPVDAVSVHDFFREAYAAYADIIAKDVDLRREMLRTLAFLMCHDGNDRVAEQARSDALAPTTLPPEWVSLLLHQLQSSSQQVLAAMCIEELTGAKGGLCEPLVAAGLCDTLLRLVQTRVDTQLCTCAMRALSNVSARYFTAWSAMVMPSAMAVYASVLQRGDVTEAVKSCVRQHIADLCIFPTCLRTFMQAGGLNTVLQRDSAAGRFRSSSTTDMLISLLVAGDESS